MRVGAGICGAAEERGAAERWGRCGARVTRIAGLGEVRDQVGARQRAQRLEREQLGVARTCAA